MLDIWARFFCLVLHGEQSVSSAELRQASVKSPTKGELSSAYALLTVENQTEKPGPVFLRHYVMYATILSYISLQSDILLYVWTVIKYHNITSISKTRVAPEAQISSCSFKGIQNFFFLNRYFKQLLLFPFMKSSFIKADR